MRGYEREIYILGLYLYLSKLFFDNGDDDSGYSKEIFKWDD